MRFDGGPATGGNQPPPARRARARGRPARHTAPGRRGAPRRLPPPRRGRALAAQDLPPDTLARARAGAVARASSRAAAAAEAAAVCTMGLSSAPDAAAAGVSDAGRAALARSAAPVRAEYIESVEASACAAGAAAVRLRSEYPLAAMERAKQADGEDDGSGETAAAAAAPMSKKQKRKAQRQHGRLGLCNNVVRSGDPSACPYGDKCKYSHDIAAYRASKPVDLPGRCPFAHPCPFGIQCRWEGSHAQAVADAEEGRPVGVVRESECSNFLRKPLMNGLRKREYDFSRADASTIKAGGKLSKFATKKGHKSVSVADAATGSPAPGPPAAEGEGEVRDKPEPAFERKAIDFDGKLYLAPLTTVGNLPFRRLCVELGIDITVGEMAMCTNLLQAQPSEWALLRRHKSEKIFGAQICGSFPDSVARACQVVEENTDVNFIDINMGCPIDLVCNAGAGASMLHRPARMEQVVRAGAGALRELPFTVKTRTGFNDGENVTHKLAPKMKEWGAAALTLHGRTRQQRYSRPADWSYVAKTAGALKDEGGTRQLPLIGNGDVYTHEDYFHHLEEHGVATCMLARGMLIKPWLATEIKERRTWDISGSERFDLMKKFANYSLEHYGSDERGVESSRRFLLEWMSFTHRYVPVGLLETQVGMQFRPPPFSGRDDRETLLASPLAKDWVAISEMLLGPVPKNFAFAPKHKSNAWADGSLTAQG